MLARNSTRNAMRVAKLRVGILRVEVRASTRLVSVNAIAHSRNFRTGNKICILAHTTCVYATYATVTVVMNVKKNLYIICCTKR